MNSEQYNTIFKNIGVEIFLEENSFLKVKETLTRIGIASNKNKTLYQSCHILHKRGMYGILHFKELFILDNKQTDINDTDIQRRNYIVKLLADWKLITVADPSIITAEISPDIIKQVKILPHSQKADWKLIPKYTIGR